MREGAQAFHSNDDGSGEIGHSSQSVVVQNFKIWGSLLPSVALLCCKKKSHCNRHFKRQKEEVAKFSKDSPDFSSPALVDAALDKTLKAFNPEEEPRVGDVRVS